jgi:Interferon-induced transmembrane protein.
MNCSKCGAQNIDGVTFCGSCGSPMRSFIPPTPETPQQNQPNEEVTFQPQQPPQYQQQQSYGSQSQGNYNSQGSSYSASGGIPYNGGMIPPKNYMTESIIVTVISTLCCCSPISIILGIIAIIKANNVNSEFERGNINEAFSNSETAKKLVIWALVITVVFCVISALVNLLLIIPTMGGLEELLNNMNSYN